MNTVANTASKTSVSSSVIAIALAAFMGLGIITIAGHAQSAALHDAAHDVRHATGFPCH